MVARLVAAAAVVGAFATPHAAAAPVATGLILYRSPPSTTARPATVRLWTTDARGGHAQEVFGLKPVGLFDPLRAAYLVPDGLILAEPRPSEPNVSEIGFVKRGSHHMRTLFSIQGLYSLRPSPDGMEIAYSRSLPAAAHATGKALSWSADERQLFAYGVTPACWFCVFSIANGAHRAITTIDLNNLWGGWPSVSPSGKRVAFPDAEGPAGERIYTTRGSFVRNLVGRAAANAFWSPDEEQLLLQPQGESPLLYSFRTRRIVAFRHDGPPDLVALDWR